MIHSSALQSLSYAQMQPNTSYFNDCKWVLYIKMKSYNYKDRERERENNNYTGYHGLAGHLKQESTKSVHKSNKIRKYHLFWHSNAFANKQLLKVALNM